MRKQGFLLWGKLKGILLLGRSICCFQNLCPLRRPPFGLCQGRVGKQERRDSDAPKMSSDLCKIESTELLRKICREQLENVVPKVAAKIRPVHCFKSLKILKDSFGPRVGGFMQQAFCCDRRVRLKLERAEQSSKQVSIVAGIPNDLLKPSESPDTEFKFCGYHSKKFPFFDGGDFAVVRKVLKLLAGPKKESPFLNKCPVDAREV